MISAGANVKVYVCAAPMDMRKGFDTLAAIVQNTLKKDPLSGHWFVFRNRKSDRLKLLLWDGTGLVLYYKRLDTGHFHWPAIRDGIIHLSAAELSLLIEGVDWRRLEKTTIQRPAQIA